jgi:hypothetical protein
LCSRSPSFLKYPMMATSRRERLGSQLHQTSIRIGMNLSVANHPIIPKS